MATAATEKPEAKSLLLLPKHHAKLLEVIEAIDTKFKEDPANIKFYVTGGAAFSYLVPEDNEHLNDIDCVCVINTDLSPAAYKATQRKAIKDAMIIIRRILDPVTYGNLEEEISQSSITKDLYKIPANYNIPSGKIENYNLKNTERTAFTGRLYEDKKRGIIVISIKQRTYPNRTVLDITFPTLEYDRDNYFTKWAAAIKPVEVPLFDGTMKMIPVLTPDALRSNQNYAAKRAINPENVSRRTRRVTRLKEKFKLLPIIEATLVSGPLPPRQRPTNVPPAPVPIVTPPMPLVPTPLPVAGGGSVSVPVSAAPTPVPPSIIIYGVETHMGQRGRLVGEGLDLSSDGYNPSKGTFIFHFPDGSPLEARIGDRFWRHPDGRLRSAPPIPPPLPSLPLSPAPLPPSPTPKVDLVSVPYADVTIGEVSPGVVTLWDRQTGTHYPGIFDQKTGMYFFKFTPRGFDGRPGDQYWYNPTRRTFEPRPPIPPRSGLQPWFTIMPDGVKYFHEGRGDIVFSIGKEIDPSSRRVRFIYDDKSFGSPGHFYRSNKGKITFIPF